MDEETFVREHMEKSAQRILLSLIMAEIFEDSGDSDAMAAEWARIFEETFQGLDLDDLGVDDSLKELAEQAGLNAGTNSISLALAMVRARRKR